MKYWVILKIAHRVVISFRTARTTSIRIFVIFCVYLLRIFDNQLFPTKCKISELINIYEFANFYSVKNPEVLDALKKLNSKIFIK